MAGYCTSFTACTILHVHVHEDEAIKCEHVLGVHIRMTGLHCIQVVDHVKMVNNEYNREVLEMWRIELLRSLSGTNTLTFLQDFAVHSNCLTQ